MRICAIAFTLLSATGLAWAQQDSTSDTEQVRRLIEEQKAQNEQLKARIDAIEAELGRSEAKPDDYVGFWTNRPDGQQRLHKETPWVDSDSTPFVYLADGDGLFAQQEQDLPPGLYYGSKKSFVEFHGFANIDYYDFERNGKRDGVSSLDAHHVYLSARAEMRANLFAFLEVEYEHGAENEIKVDRAYISWMMVKEPAPALAREFGLEFGLRFAPFGINKQLTTLAPLRNSVGNPAVLDEFGHGDWPMVGVFATGVLGFEFEKGSSLDYTVGLVNGENGLEEDTSGGTRDNNSPKTAIINVGFTPFSGHDTLGSLRIGLSHLMRNRYSDAGDPRLKTSMTGVDLYWIYQGFELRSEYVARRADDDTVNGIEGRGFGYYVEASYDVVPNLTTLKLPFAEKDNFNMIRPFVRFNRTDTPLDSTGFTTGIAGGHLTRWDIGVMVSPYEHLKFRIEYQMADTGVSAFENNGILASTTLDF